jgi:exopolysaccharide production protein ExoZ
MDGGPLRCLKRILELSQGHDRMLPMEGLRGLAVFLVFLNHYFTLSSRVAVEPSVWMTIGHKVAGYGNLGVELFFVLSGYLIYGTLLRRRP